MALYPYPAGFGSAGVGASDGSLKKVLDQLRGAKLLTYTATAAITTGVKGTATLSDGTNNSLRVDARLFGTHGNSIFRAATRNTVNGQSVFDLEVAFTNANAATTISGVATTSVNTTNDTWTKTAHGLATGSGPFQPTTDAGALPAGMTSIPYWIVRVDADTVKFATSYANAVATVPVVVDITTQGTTGPFNLTAMLYEKFKNVSMLDTHPRYVERVVNTGADGNAPSEYITVTDLDSAAAEDRPTAHTMTVLASGAGEVTVTGVQRGDHILAVWNHSTGVLGSSTLVLDATDKDKVVLSAGTFVTANTNIVMLQVLPKQ